MADVMDTQPVWVPGDTTVLQAQDEFFLRYHSRPSITGRQPDLRGASWGCCTRAAVDGAVEDGQPTALAHLRCGGVRRRR